MWMVDPVVLCKSHLLSEHQGLHTLAGMIRKGRPLTVYANGNLIETQSIQGRHDELAVEMARRGGKHRTPLDYIDELSLGEVDRVLSLYQLVKRCAECMCRWRHTHGWYVMEGEGDGRVSV